MSRRDQGLAVIAAKVVMKISPFTKDVRTRLVQLPTLLHRNGLAATLAFVSSKAEGQDTLSQAYEHVRDLLIERIQQSRVTGAEGFRSLTDTASIEWLKDLPAKDYGRLTAEVADAVLWVKRLSEARRAELRGGARR